MGEALQVVRLKCHVFERFMNARIYAALAIMAGLFFVTEAPRAAENPFAGMSGNWSGNGKITVDNGSSERIRCRGTYKTAGNGLALSLRCASDSYKFELGSDITSDGGNLSGSWNEASHGVFGSLAGRVTGGLIQATASAVGFSATLTIRTTATSQSVSIKSPGSEISEVSITMARAGAGH